MVTDPRKMTLLYIPSRTIPGVRIIILARKFIAPLSWRLYDTDMRMPQAEVPSGIVYYG